MERERETNLRNTSVHIFIRVIQYLRYSFMILSPLVADSVACNLIAGKLLLFDLQRRYIWISVIELTIVVLTMPRGIHRNIIECEM